MKKIFTNEVTTFILLIVLIISFTILLVNVRNYSYFRANIDFSHNIQLISCWNDETYLDTSPNGEINTMTEIWLAGLKGIDDALFKVFLSALSFGYCSCYFIIEFEKMSKRRNK